MLQLPAGSTPTVVVSGEPPVYHVQIGFPGAFSPTFGTNVTVNMIPNGDPASGTIDNTDPLTTGISAHDRARTVQVAVARHARPEDIVTRATSSRSPRRRAAC